MIRYIKQRLYLFNQVEHIIKFSLLLKFEEISIFNQYFYLLFPFIFNIRSSSNLNINQNS